VTTLISSFKKEAIVDKDNHSQPKIIGEKMQKLRERRRRLSLKSAFQHKATLKR